MREKLNGFSTFNFIKEPLDLQSEFFDFCCDECARPLHLYGENFIETYTNGKANALRCLCDLCADEMGVNA